MIIVPEYMYACAKSLLLRLSQEPPEFFAEISYTRACFYTRLLISAQLQSHIFCNPSSKLTFLK
jgi:hypothetical protein